MLASMDAVPSTWCRYIDDIFAIWPHGEEQLTEFLEKISTFYPSIRFMAQWSVKSVTFLDTKVMVENEGCITTDLYVKPADTHQYLHRDSCLLATANEASLTARLQESKGSAARERTIYREPRN